jgi:hypothetical protein
LFTFEEDVILSLPAVSGCVLTFLVEIQRIRMGDCVSRDILVTLGVPQGCYLDSLCFILFVNDIAQIFEYVRACFTQVSPCSWSSGLHENSELVDWCGANSLKLNVGKCKSITLSRLRHPVEFSYMLEGIILDRVDSITDLEVVMDSKMSFSRHIDVTVGMALAMLRFVKRLSGEFTDSYTLRTLYVSLVHPKL